jgi:hypothetical protein
VREKGGKRERKEGGGKRVQNMSEVKLYNNVIHCFSKMFCSF